MHEQARRSSPPSRVRSPTDRQFASGCSPRRFGPTQLPSATELWHTPTRTFTVLMWHHHRRTHSRMFLAGIQGRFRTGPPTKTFGGDDLGRIAKKYVEVKALLNKSSNQCPGVVLDGLDIKLREPKSWHILAPISRKATLTPKDPARQSRKQKNLKIPLLYLPRRGGEQRGDSVPLVMW